MINFLKVCKIPFHFEHDYQSCAKEFLGQGADATIRNDSGWSPIISAAAANNLDVIKLFFEKLYQKDEGQDEWQKAMFIASAKNCVEVLQFLHTNNAAKIDATENTVKMTAVHYACAGDAYEATIYLINNGASINGITKDGCSPLYIAASLGKLNLVKLLIQNQAEVDIPNTHGNTALFSAAAGGFLDIVTVLHDSGANISITDDDGDTPLHDAAAREHTGVVEYLISKEASTDHRNKNGKTPLDLAKENEKAEVVEILTLL